MNRLLTGTVLLCGLAFLAAFPAPQARAEGDGDASLIPDAMAFTDRKKLVSIKLPRSWSVQREKKVKAGQLVHWAGAFSAEAKKDQIDSRFRVNAETAFAQAALARFWYQTQTGEPIEGSLKQGEGWEQVACRDRRRDVVHWFRCVEKDGVVFRVIATCHKKTYENYGPTIEGMLSTFKVIGAVPPETPPEGFKAKKYGKYMVWTDGDDKQRITTASKAAAVVQGVAAKALDKPIKAKPIREDMPLLRVFRNIAKYDEEAEDAGAGKPNTGFYHRRDGSTYLKMSQTSVTAFDSAAFPVFAEQMLGRYFGGTTPMWIRSGLVAYIAWGALDGKPEKPSGQRIIAATRAAKRSKPLNTYFVIHEGFIDEHFASKDGQSSGEGTQILWAYHWWLRHGRGSKKYRKPYFASLQALRASGSPDQAHAAWGDVDFEAMHADFLKAMGKWEK